jgi:hypothetical protein
MGSVRKAGEASEMRELKPVLVIVAAAAVVLLVVLALKGGSTEIVVQPSYQLPPPGDVGPAGTPVAVVAAMREDNETTLLGLIRVRTHYIVGVQFYAPAECATSLGDGNPWPVSASGCETDVPIEGVVAGSGTAATGETIVLVDTEVSGECFNTLQPNDSWPPESPACAQPSSG